jgi:hypothetical protein
LYISSGVNKEGILARQTFAVDLSVSWNITSPAYTKLPLGPWASWFPTAISADGQKWFALVQGVGYVFGIQSRIWSIVFNYADAYEIDKCGAVTDPETGKIFIPFAYKLPSGIRSMLIVDLQTNSYTSDNSTFPVSNQTTYAVTWNAQLKSLLYGSFGAMYTYNLSDGWKTFNPPPGLRASNSYCMVSSSSGSIVVLFGGFSSVHNAAVGDIFILDVPTRIWRKGASTRPGDVRRSPACAVSNGYFIAWGGDMGNAASIIPPDHMAIVYSLETDKWTSGYMVTNHTDNETASNKDTSSVSRTTGLIIGAVIGGFVIGLIIEYRVRKSRSKSCSSPVPTNAATNKRRGTVQEGAFGSEPEPQGSESASHAFEPPSVHRHPHIVRIGSL